MQLQVGYCTNVHAGKDLEETRANLQQHALAVKSLVSPEQPMGVGLWLSASTAESLRASNRLDHVFNVITNLFSARKEISINQTCHNVVFRQSDGKCCLRLHSRRNLH